MTRFAIWSLAIFAATMGSASAQGISPNGQNGFMPNIYNRQNQPLSPYLNLLRGGSPAVNYFYGVRPGLQSGGYLGPYGNQTGAAAGPRQTFFPLVDSLANYSPDDPPSGMPATGHPVGFQTTLSYFGGTSLNGNTANPGAANNTRRGPQQQPNRR